MQAPQTEIILRHDGIELARVVVAPGTYIVGRGEEAEIIAETPLLSRKHAQLTIHHDHLVLEDLGSSNGTFVNDQAITESTRLFPNQSVRLGDVELEIHRQRPTQGPGEPVEPAPSPLQRVLPDELLTSKRYAVGKIVAQGGMGAILAAQQSAMKRGVAMKVMLAHREESDVLRFIEEAQITGQLEHPNIVPVHEIGVDENDQLYYTMKMVRGITLQKVLDLIAQGLEGTIEKYPLATLLTIFQKACDAIAFAHARGVIHRDLKPDNLMLGDFGEVLVMDWGLAKVLGRDEIGRAAEERAVPYAPDGDVVPRAGPSSSRILLQPSASTATLAGTIMGTPQYISPEQARGEIEFLDGRSDIYSLGTILFNLLYLRPPIPAGDPNQMVGMAASGFVDWPSAKETGGKKFPHLPGGQVPDSLLAVCRKALAAAPPARYATVAELQLDLTAYQTGFATSAENAGAWKQFRFFIRRNRAVSLAVAAAVLIITTVTALFTVNVIHERNRAETTINELRSTAPTFSDQARALVEGGQIDEALGKISYATRLDPGNVEYQLQRANYLQVALRLHDASAGYRIVLGLRPDEPGAQKNQALCERLLAANGGKDDLPKPLLVELVNSLLAQGRLIEANPLAQRVGQNTAATETALRARLKAVLSQPGWNNNRLRLQPNGTIMLNLNDLRFTDLNSLRGFPISALDLSDPAVTDISPLAGMPLNRLGLSGTGVTDLRPLAGSPVETLYLYGLRIKDLTPLRTTKVRELYLNSNELTDLNVLQGLALEVLSVYGNKITDLSPLRGMPLRQLSIGNNPIVDFSPLTGLPLEKLDINMMNLTALPPLKGLPLRTLNISSNRISDLTPLAGLPLRSLTMPYNLFTDLNPLRKMPLQYLDLACDQRGVDLAPLADCRDLEEVILPRYFLHEEVLRTLPKLRRARFHLLQQFALPMAQFWNDIKPEWVAVGHCRTLLQMPGIKLQNNSPVQTDPDGTLFLDLNHADGAPLPSLTGLPISRISLDGANVSDLNFLRGLPLKRLSINGTKVTDLSPLQGMQLVAFNASGTPLTDLSALRGMPLQVVNLGGTKIKTQDLALLAGCPLQEVNFNATGILDASFLRNKALRKVSLASTAVANLDFLSNAPLETLDLYGTQVTDLSALQGKPLQNLQISYSRVRDLSPLRGLPLTELSMSNTSVQDFAVLTELPKLERLRYSGSPAQVLIVRHHPALKFIANSYNAPFVQADEFWATYDAGQTKK